MDETTLTEHRTRETSPAPPTAAPATDRDPATEADELLVEEISIDGMCGVY